MNFYATILTVERCAVQKRDQGFTFKDFYAIHNTNSIMALAREKGWHEKYDMCHIEY
jgi:hypothetical protein